MTTPSISVCIPVYNGERFIAQAIESVLAQTWGDYELLVIDNCSTDRTREIVAAYAESDKRLTLLANESNLGMVGNWNRCLEKARGEYIKFLFADDTLSDPRALERFHGAFIGASDITLVASARHVIDAQSRHLRTISHFREGIIGGNDVIHRSLSEGRNLIGEPSVVMFRRTQTARGFDARYRQIVDLEMWLHLLESGSFAYIEEPLASFRVHEDQETKKNARDMAGMYDMILLFEEYSRRPAVGLDPLSSGMLLYRQHYQIWKSAGSSVFSDGRIPYSAARFFLMLPLYKIFNPLWKMRASMSRKGR